MIPGNIMTEKNAKILQRINTYAEEKLADIDPQKTPVSVQLETLKPIMQTIADEEGMSLEDMFILYMDLASENIHMNLDSNVVYATGKMDSTTQQLTGTPVFKMGSDQYEQTEMMFNFKTKKGFITDVYTQQEDGYLTSEHSKRGANGEMYLEHGRYTTCDDPHPDFYIAMSRAKVRPGKDVVFGPAYLVVADVPLPLAIPYGFFPFTRSYSSGFIMPTLGRQDGPETSG